MSRGRETEACVGQRSAGVVVGVRRALLPLLLPLLLLRSAALLRCDTPPPFTHPLYSKPSTNPTDDRVPQAVGARHQRRRRRVRVCRRRRFGEHPSAPHRGGLRKGGRRRQRQGGGQVILRTRAPLPPRCRQCQCSRPRRVQRPRPFPPARAPPRRAGEKQLVQPRERLRARAALGSQSIVPQFFLPY